MKKLKVALSCLATYEAVIDVDDDMSLEDAIKYANDNIQSIPIGDLNYIGDSDEIDEELCSFVEDE